MNGAALVTRFLVIFFWEFMQNVPPMVGLALAALWFSRHRGRALALTLAGGVLGALAIEITEPMIHAQPPSFTLGAGFWVNALAFSVLGVLGVLYLARPRKRWIVDAGVGCGLAFVLALAQALFDGSSLLAFAVHGLALSLTFALVLISLRWVLAGAVWAKVVGRVLLLNGIGTAIIVVLDYGHLIV